jgi:hypothetical protein
MGEITAETQAAYDAWLRDYEDWLVGRLATGVVLAEPDVTVISDLSARVEIETAASRDSAAETGSIRARRERPRARRRHGSHSFAYSSTKTSMVRWDRCATQLATYREAARHFADSRPPV